MDERHYSRLSDEYRTEWGYGKKWRDFLKYFDRYYGRRTREWVNCYRSGLVITTNNNVEYFFNHLKSNLKSTGNKRLDKLIHVLLGLSQFYYNKYFREIRKGKGFKDEAQAKRHRIAGGMNAECLSVRKVGEWAIRTKGELIFIVNGHGCSECICINRCELCGACANRFSCIQSLAFLYEHLEINIQWSSSMV